MKVNIYIFISFILLLAGRAVESQETARDPEGALTLIEDEAKKRHIYGSYKIDEHTVLEEGRLMRGYWFGDYFTCGVC